MEYLVEKTFHLNPGYKQDLLDIINEHKAELQADKHIKDYHVLYPRDEDDIVSILFVLNEGANWDERMQQEYVLALKKEILDKKLVNKISDKHLIHHVYEK